jgi:hypothetical protein
LAGKGSTHVDFQDLTPCVEVQDMMMVRSGKQVERNDWQILLRLTAGHGEL